MNGLPFKKTIYIICFTAVMTSWAVSRDLSLDFLGQQIIPHNYRFQNTTVGGLSALEYDAKTDRYVALSDDRSSINPARFYGLTLNYNITGFQNWRITDVHYMRRPDGSYFPKASFLGADSVDPEALRLSPAGNRYFWTSEGHAKYGVNPFIREMDMDGGHIRDFTVPDKYLVGPGKGVRNNLAFEALTINRDQTSLTLSPEGPLVQDGPVPDSSHGAPVRFLQFNISSGKATHEYVYGVSPVHKETLPFGNFSVSGVVAILALSPQEFLVVERSFSTGAGLSVKLYLADFTGATDVLNQESLKDARYQAAHKTLLLDLGTLGIEVDNIEGMSLGKTLKNGRRTLLLISDNNFRAAQVTQILAFAISGLD